MKHWRENRDGSKTLVDDNTSNNYSDGYNAGRRYRADYQVNSILRLVGLGLMFGLGYLVGSV